MASRDKLLDRLAQLEEYETRRAGKHLHTFLRAMWGTVEPSRPFKNNWHIEAVCEHLQAVREGQIKNLLINQPPATTKSLTASVMFPAWCWATAPWMRFMCVSFDQSLSSRDNIRMRNVVLSPEFQSRWPVELSEDQNEKTRYNTTAGGWRIGTSITGRIVGEHPHGKIVDDPHNTKQKVLSEKDLAKVHEVWDQGLSTRGATLGAWNVVLMQRLHENDLSGHWLASGDSTVVHLCLPMKYEPAAFVDLGGGRREKRERMPVTPIGWRDPRTKPGELLWPEEWTPELVDRIVKTQLGTWGESGQFQQRPTPAGGLLFQRTWFNLIDVAPKVQRWVRFWDVAGTEGGDGARTAGVKMGLTEDGRVIIDGGIIKGRWTSHQVDEVIKATAQLDGRAVAIREEQEPGSSGLAVIRARTRTLMGYDYEGETATGDKVTRARPLMVQAEAGNVYVVTGGPEDQVRRDLVQEFFAELETFPLGSTKDQVDAAAGAFNVLTAIGDPQGVIVSDNVIHQSVETELSRLKQELGLS